MLGGYCNTTNMPAPDKQHYETLPKRGTYGTDYALPLYAGYAKK
jgi:hypothetical protein